MMALREWIGEVTRRPLAVRCGPIGVEVAKEKLHMVQLQQRGVEFGLRAHASVPFPTRRGGLLDSDRAFRKVLARGLASDSFKGRRAVLAMPAGQFRTVSLSYQLASGQTDEAAIAALMAERLDGDLNDYVVDFLPVRTRSGDGERLALVAVSRRTDVLRYLELARVAGLRVDALEIGPAAIRRLVGVMPSDGDADVTLVINTGLHASYLTMIGGRRLLFDQELKFGEEALLERLAGALDMTAARARTLALKSGLRDGHRDAGALEQNELYDTLLEIVRPELQHLVEEIDRAFLYVASEMRGGAVTRVYLLGAVARWPGMDEVLSELTRVTITNMPNPLSLFGGNDDFADATSDSLAPELAVATGLALRGLDDG